MTEHQFKQAFDTYRMYVYYFCNKMIENQQEAEDITTTVFIKLWQNIEKVSIESCKAFLLVTANNKCLDYIKVTNHRREMMADFFISDLEAIEIDQEVLSYIYSFIQTLHPQEKKMVLLKYKDGKEVKEISKLLGLKPQTISNTLRTALARIREEIKNRGIRLG